MIKDNTIFLNGLDNACLGVVFSGQSVYHYDLLVDEVMKQRSLTKIEAVSFVDFNIVNAYLGECTPIIVYKAVEEDA